MTAASSASASLTSPLLLSGGPSGMAVGSGGDASAPWSWLPDEVRSALRRGADGLVTEEELVRGFNPLNHMDVSSEEFFTITLAVDKAEEAAAAKAMAAIGRERTLKREDKSMAASAAASTPTAGAEAAAGETPAEQTLPARAPSTRASSRATSSRMESGRTGGSSAAVAESLVAAAWADLMSHLVEQAPTAAALRALSLRHELQPQVPGLPYRCGGKCPRICFSRPLGTNRNAACAAAAAPRGVRLSTMRVGSTRAVHGNKTRRLSP